MLFQIVFIAVEMFLFSSFLFCFIAVAIAVVVVGGGGGGGGGDGFCGGQWWCWWFVCLNDALSLKGANLNKQINEIGNNEHKSKLDKNKSLFKTGNAQNQTQAGNKQTAKISWSWQQTKQTQVTHNDINED